MTVLLTNCSYLPQCRRIFTGIHLAGFNIMAPLQLTVTWYRIHHTEEQDVEWRQGGRGIGRKEGIYTGRKTGMEAGREVDRKEERYIHRQKDTNESREGGG